HGLGVDEMIVGDDEYPEAVAPVNLGGKAVQVSAGQEHTCALLVGGEGRCWGENSAGQLGYGHTQPGVGDPAAQGPVLLGGGAGRVEPRLEYTCALMADGAVRCWGWNEFGQLGVGHQRTIGDEPGEMPPAPVFLYVGP